MGGPRRAMCQKAVPQWSGPPHASGTSPGAGVEFTCAHVAATQTERRAGRRSLLGWLLGSEARAKVREALLLGTPGPFYVFAIEQPDEAVRHEAASDGPEPVAGSPHRCLTPDVHRGWRPRSTRRLRA